MQLSVDVLIWMIIGIALLSSEAFTGTFHLLFFGLAALLTAVLASLGLTSPALQLVIFAAFSLISAGLLRKRLVHRTSKGFTVDKDSRFQVEVDIPSGGEAVIRYQGAPWTAVNSSPLSVLKGDRVRVLRTEGIKLIIEPDPVE